MASVHAVIVYYHWIKKQFFQHPYPGPEVQARFQSHSTSYSIYELVTGKSGSRTGEY